MFEIANWYHNFRAPSVLMIDDLSDAYLDVYKEKYKNDWGHLCDAENSLFKYLKNHLIIKFPDIKITFFVPYLAHGNIEPASKYDTISYDVGRRPEFTDFLKNLTLCGHEIAHHGSNHGKYIKNSNSSHLKWVQEWELYENNRDIGVETTKRGKEVFKASCGIEIMGGKFCGYKQVSNSLDIINDSIFLYWCDEVSYTTKRYNIRKYKNTYLMPTTFPGNAFVRLKYLTGDRRKDRIKVFTKYFQSIYNLYQHLKLIYLYVNKFPISIQEHYSPATTRGLTQSTNVISDMDSLLKIYNFLNKKSIWYTTVFDLIKYVYARENTKLKIENNKITVDFINHKKIKGCKISLISKKYFSISGVCAKYNNSRFVVDLELKDGVTVYEISQS